MRVYAPNGILRTNGVDFSDLTKATQAAPAWWDSAAMALVIPFDPEPTAAEQVLIRRRLMTRDAADEAWVGWYVAQLAALTAAGQTGPLVDLVRGLVSERLGEIDAPNVARPPAPSPPQPTNPPPVVSVEATITNPLKGLRP